jgi:hypothetical protein
MKNWSLLAVAIVLSSGTVHAEGPDEPYFTPLSVSLVRPVAIPWSEPKIVAGLSVNLLHGRNRAVYGIEVGGLLNGEETDFGGVQVSGIRSLIGSVSSTLPSLAGCRS